MLTPRHISFKRSVMLILVLGNVGNSHSISQDWRDGCSRARLRGLLLPYLYLYGFSYDLQDSSVAYSSTLFYFKIPLGLRNTKCTMGLLKLFWSKARREKEEKISHFATLIALGGIDGNFSKEEMELVSSLMARDKIFMPSDLAQVRKYVKKCRIIVPKEDNVKKRNLIELVSLMLVDGKISQKEMALCQSVAKKYGYPPHIINGMVDIIRDDFNSKQKEYE